VSDPEDERNVLRIKVKSGGENDNVTVASTASTVPVRIEGGSDDDTVTVGDPSHGVDNILGFSTRRSVWARSSWSAAAIMILSSSTTPQIPATTSAT